MADLLTLFGGGTVALDSRGYLANLDDWSEEVAEAMAQSSDITLTPDHWEVVYLVRLFFERFEHAPSMRPLIKFLKAELKEPSKATSIHLMSLFPGSPATLVAKVAGLPRPDNCL